jgi:hypothetical protein
MTSAGRQPARSARGRKGAFNVTTMVHPRLYTVRGHVRRVGGTSPLGLALELSNGDEVSHVLPEMGVALRVGDDASLILRARARAGTPAVLGVVNHSLVDGENFVRSTARQRPDAWDAVLVSAGFAGTVGAVGQRGLVPFVILGGLYLVAAIAVPAALRARLARRVDHLLDLEARAGKDGLPARGAEASRQSAWRRR